MFWNGCFLHRLRFFQTQAHERSRNDGKATNRRIEFYSLFRKNSQLRLKEKIASLSNPIVLAAIICAVFLYSGLAHIKESRNFASLFKAEDIVEIAGKVVSNPVKDMEKNTYSFEFLPTQCVTRKRASSTCRGCVRAIVPAAVVEAFFPGKLYSVAKTASKNGGILCENGANLLLRGKFAMENELFISKSAESLGWDAGVFGRLAYFRALSRLQFRRLMYFWGEAGGLFLALLSGIKDYTDKNLSDAFRKAGLSHILALSGMHLSLFSALSKKISTKLAGDKISSIFQLASVCIFVWFAGFSPSLFRAFLCSVIFLIAKTVNYKRIKMIYVLALSFLIHTVFFPYDVFSVAFKLSYGALVGILLFGEFFTSLFSPFIPICISSPLGASAGANCFTAPISARLFRIVTPIGIVSSVVVSPLITVFIYAGLFLIFFSLCFPFFAPMASFFMKMLYSIIERLVLFFSKCPAIQF